MEERNITKASYEVTNQMITRINHKVIPFGHNFLVLGGVDTSGSYIPTFVKLNKDNYEVSLIPVKTAIKIQHFAIFSYKQQVFIWGGIHDAKVSNSLLAFNRDQFLVQEQRGDIPSPRHSFGSAFINPKFLLIYGGMSEESCFCDCALLNCQTMQWRKIDVSLSLYSFRPSVICYPPYCYILITEIYSSKQPLYCCDLYQFALSELESQLITLEKVSYQSNLRVSPLRGYSTVTGMQLSSPCIVVLGGEQLSLTSRQLFSDVWVFNLQTLRWLRIDGVSITPKIGMEAVVHRQKIFLLGGATSCSQLSNKVDVIDFKRNDLATKFCNKCIDVYALKSNAMVLTLKYCYPTTQQSFYSCNIIQQMAKLIPTEQSAIALLIDNSLNLNATTVAIQYISQGTILAISANCEGLSKDQLLDTLYSFSFRNENYGYDAKIQKQNRIIREYGVNLKAAALRLGQVCLLVKRTKTNETCVAYLQTLEKEAVFKMHSYVLSEMKEVSSHSQRIFIKQKARLHFKQIAFEQLNECSSRVMIACLHESASSLNNLPFFLKHLHLHASPRHTIKLHNKPIKQTMYLLQLRRMEEEGTIKRINTRSVEKYFHSIALYKNLQHTGENKNSNFILLLYHQNRLIQQVQRIKQLFGCIELLQSTEVDIFKSGFLKKTDEMQLYKLLQKMIENNKC